MSIKSNDRFTRGGFKELIEKMGEVAKERHPDITVRILLTYICLCEEDEQTATP